MLETELINVFTKKGRTASRLLDMHFSKVFMIKMY